MDLDAGALRTMRAVSDAGTISGAARTLGTSQPALSQQLRRLERRLGTALVERSGRGVRLTEAGEVLARHGGAVTAALDAATEEVAALTGLRSGRVRLVAFPSSSATLVPRALALLRQRHPGVRVTFAEAEPPESVAELRAGRYDLAVAFTYPGTDVGRGGDVEGLVTRDLVTDGLWLALPRGPKEDGDEAPHLADLADRTWIAGCPRCRGHLLQVCADAGFTPEIAYETDDYVAVLGLVAAGLGVAMLPGLSLDLARHADVSLHPVRPATSRTVQAVTTPDLLRVPAVGAALQALQDAASRSGSAGSRGSTSARPTRTRRS
ncbi:MAG TPA: LysR substrate-binding domain-containing protein [Actinomycetales bacterium]|nr:LysR substrate-binding domain-containing protein [Actinomycetales bacterium]